MKTLVFAILVVLLQQNIQQANGIPCSSDPCKLVPGTFDGSTGYCCYDVPPTYTDSICTCPNNVQTTFNAPCRTAVTPAQTFCNRTCVNGGVCNIVSGAEVCWCLSGFSGSNCEIQGIAARCATGLCQSGTCVEQTLGATVFAYCHCTPGCTGTTCSTCYFTCSRIGVFPDTAFCAIGRYFYCPQATGAPVSAMCPDGLRFNRLTNNCEANYQCT